MARPSTKNNHKETKELENSNKEASSINNSSNLLDDDSKDFASDLIKQLNKEAGSVVAFNIEQGEAPTNVHRWLSTGSTQLDYIISNKPKKQRNGLPEGRIIEIQAPSGIGKSHIAALICKDAQQQGGIAVYIDSENATSIENLGRLGVQTGKNLVFIQEGCTESVFRYIESIIMKARAMTKDVPVVVVWDSIAATSPKAELEGDYEQNTIGLQARVLGKGFRKITNILANQKVTLIAIQQQRQSIGVMFSDPTVTPGGKALGYASSVRIRLDGGSQVKVKEGKEEKVIGINVYAKVIKNRMSFPFRRVDFQIHFGKGIVEDEQIFDHLREWCDNNKSNPCIYENKRIWVEGMQAWKTFCVADNSSGEILKEIKFYKADFGDTILRNREIEDYITALMDSAYIMKNQDHITYKGGSEVEIVDNGD